jgi:hypothetical protein
MLATVQQRCPALLPMVAWAHGRHSCLLLQQAEAVVHSQSVVGQGTPSGDCCLPSPSKGPSRWWQSRSWPMAYADDTFLQGTPKPTMPA